MSKAHIPRSLRQRVMTEFGNQCAYCHSLTAITGARLVIDHIIPEVAGGETTRENLRVACHSCNEFKDATTEAVDSLTGERVSLFHPRRHQWNEHFSWSEDATMMIGLSPSGRATVQALNMNHLDIVEARRRWVRVGWHPPEEDLL